MDANRRYMELRTVTSNLDIALKNRDWAVVDRVAQRLTELTMQARDESDF